MPLNIWLNLLDFFFFDRKEDFESGLFLFSVESCVVFSDPAEGILLLKIDISLLYFVQGMFIGSVYSVMICWFRACKFLSVQSLETALLIKTVW